MPAESILDKNKQHKLAVAITIVVLIGLITIGPFAC